MVEKRKPIKVDEAIKRVMAYQKSGSIEFLPIEESFGRFLGDDLIATHDVPFFSRSPYDGFAIIAADTEHASSTNPVQLEVVGEIGAGSVFPYMLQPGQAVRIMTGAAIPQGADAVIMLELVCEIETDGKPFIQVRRKVKSGDNISLIGEDTKKAPSLPQKERI